MTVLHGSSEKPDTALNPVPGSTGPAGSPKALSGPLCPECRQSFRPVHSRQLFCSVEHKAAFHNRATIRGRTLTPVAMAARITRDGSTGNKGAGKEARRESRRLLDQWAREDREAGRMSMVDYMAARWKIGY